MVLTADVLQDELAVSLACVIASANARARENRVDVHESLITITQTTDNGASWRVNYGPKGYIDRRGGDFVVDVDAQDGHVIRVRHGQ